MRYLAKDVDMEYGYVMLLIVSGLFFSFLILQGWRYFLRIQRVNFLRQQPFPSKYRHILETLRHYQALTLEEKDEIHFLIQRFIDEKQMIGLQGLTLTDEIKVIISFYACLLLLYLPKHDLYGTLDTIYIYPYEFVYKEIRDYGGVRAKERLILEGMSANDTMLLSWHNVKKDVYHHFPSNVIIHEFAHEIDFLDGNVDGVPPMDDALYATWSHYLFKAYERLNSKSIKGRFLGKYKLFGNYAASSEAEFFAVATERFFQTPLALKKKFPAVYKELKKFYRIDTALKFSNLY